MSQSPSKQSNTESGQSQGQGQGPATKRPVSGISPYICVNDGRAAIEFYQRAFGAITHELHPAQDGKKIMHASLEINGGLLMMSDDFPEFMGGKSRTPQAFGGSPVVIHLDLPDVDAVWKQAVAAGAKIAIPHKDQFWGDRYGQLTDPFGHTWSLSTPVRKDGKQAQESGAAVQKS